MRTSLGIWAFGAMATRFNPGGDKPEPCADSWARFLDGVGQSAARFAPPTVSDACQTPGVACRR